MSTKLFDFYAKSHAGFLHGAGSSASAQLLQLLPIQGQQNMLELGCGTGASLVLLARHYPHLQLHGSDVNPRMLFCGVDTYLFIAQKPTTHA